MTNRNEERLDILEMLASRGCEGGDCGYPTLCLVCRAQAVTEDADTLPPLRPQELRALAQAERSVRIIAGNENYPREVRERVAAITHHWPSRRVLGRMIYEEVLRRASAGDRNFPHLDTPGPVFESFLHSYDLYTICREHLVAKAPCCERCGRSLAGHLYCPDCPQTQGDVPD